jgi:dTMP kinase
LDIEWCKNPDCGLLTPDIVFYLNVEPERAAIRSDYGEERYETLDLQKRVRNIFFSLMDDSWTVNLFIDIRSLMQKETLVKFIKT